MKATTFQAQKKSKVRSKHKAIPCDTDADDEPDEYASGFSYQWWDWDCLQGRVPN
jgi:hypothetical protein